MVFESRLTALRWRNARVTDSYLRHPQLHLRNSRTNHDLPGVSPATGGTSGLIRASALSWAALAGASGAGVGGTARPPGSRTLTTAFARSVGLCSFDPRN